MQNYARGFAGTGPINWAVGQTPRGDFTSWREQSTAQISTAPLAPRSPPFASAWVLTEAASAVGASREIP